MSQCSWVILVLPLALITGCKTVDNLWDKHPFATIVGTILLIAACYSLTHGEGKKSIEAWDRDRRGKAELEEKARKEKAELEELERKVRRKALEKKLDE